MRLKNGIIDTKKIIKYFIKCEIKRWVNMKKDNETPEERRERLRQGELKNQSSSVHGSNLADLVGGSNWKVTGSLILVAILIFFIYAIFFK